MFKLLLVTIVIIAFSVIALAIKMFLVKGGEFKKSCNSIDPRTGKPFGCTCGKNDDKKCSNK